MEGLLDRDGKHIDFGYPMPERSITRKEFEERLAWYSEHLRLIGVTSKRKRRSIVSQIARNIAISVIPDRDI